MTAKPLISTTQILLMEGKTYSTESFTSKNNKLINLVVGVQLSLRESLTYIIPELIFRKVLLDPFN